MSTLLLVDGHSQAYRAFFGVKTPLTTRDGEPTTAVYGFVRKLLSVLREYQPEYATVAFDAGDTWRHSEFPAYKATRDAMPDEMRTQIARIVEFLQVFNIPVVTYPNFEADDILGTLAKQAAEQGHDVLILSGDRDMFQLISERVRILYTKGGPNPETVAYGLPELHARYGLTPEQFVDLKALTGDSSDNIPGVTGVGEKTAIKFLTDFGTIDNLYLNLDKISGPKTRQNLDEAREQIERNRRLMTIGTDLGITFDPAAAAVSDYDQHAVIKLFNALEFRSLVKELPPLHGVSELPDTATPDGQLGLFGESDRTQPAEPPTTPAGVSYAVIRNAQELADLTTVLQNAPLISFDVETTSTDAMQARLVGLGIAWNVGEGAYIPVSHNQGEQLPWEEVRAALHPIFANPDIPFVGHNGKYDLTVCRRHGLEIHGPIYDTMVMAWVIDPGSRSLGLKALAADLLDWQMTELTEPHRQWSQADHHGCQVPIDLASAYCGADVDATIRLYALLRAKLAGRRNVGTLSIGSSYPCCPC